MVKPLEVSGQMPDLQRHSKQGMLQEEMRTNHMISDMLNTNNNSYVGVQCVSYQPGEEELRNLHKDV